MKITCDKCGASYKIPAEKLTRDVSKATCKKCGEKIIIRRPGNDGYEDPRLTGGLHASNDDDGVVEHNEERTVIAVVPELQRFDATPPLAAGGSVPDPSQMGQMGLNPIQAPAAQPSAPAQPVRPAEEPRRVQTPPAPAPAPVSASQATVPQPRPSSTGTMAPVAPPAPTPSPSVAAPVFSSATGRTGTAKPVRRAKATWMAVGPLVVAVIGMLLYIPDGLWGIANFQAVGFMLAMFGSLAAIVLQVELIRSGALNLMVGFLVPSLGVVGLGVGLLQTQQVPFLTEGVKDNLDLIIATASQPTAPEAADLSLSERVKVKRQTATARRNTNPIKLPGSNLPDTSNLSSGDPNAVQGPDGPKNTGGPGDVTNPEAITGTGASPITGRRPTRGESTFGQVASNDTQLDTEGISSKMDSSKVTVCFTTSLNGMAAPKGLEFTLTLDPSGKAISGKVRSPSDFQGSALEKCLQERIRTVSFPTFEGSKPQSYTHKFH